MSHGDRLRGGASRSDAGTPVVSVRADLDVPGETGRQARIFAVWLVCLALAIVVGASVGAHIPVEADGTDHARLELSRARADRAKVGVILGLVVPSLLTWYLHARHRRGGAHARGIVVDITDAGELRVWGRGHGVRVGLAGATVTERLVDVYAGRLGAWRQRRLRVRGAPPTWSGVEIELATLATRPDAEQGLRLDGGEGDCVELARSDYERIRERVLAAAPSGERTTDTSDSS